MTVRYGVIGTGMMGIEHIENLNAIDGATVTAISDPDAGSRASGQQAASAKPGFTISLADFFIFRFQVKGLQVVTFEQSQSVPVDVVVAVDNG